ncbi:MAG: hypothetical protein ACE5H3_06725 [Planctomycetota bacterium]
MNLEQEDLLISRALDGDASSSDWRKLGGLAEDDPAVWSRLAETLRVQSALTQGAERILDRVQEVEAPLSRSLAGPVLHPGLRPFFAWSGWAAALLLAFFWAFGPGHSRESLSGDSTLQASQPALHGLPGEATLVGELPRVMVDAQPSGEGRMVEVTYLRRFLEKVLVDDLYQVNSDEWGEPRAVPAVALPRSSQEPL